MINSHTSSPGVSKRIIAAYTLFFISQSQSIFPLLAPLGLIAFIIFRFVFSQGAGIRIRKKIHLPICVFTAYTFFLFMYSLVQSRGGLISRFLDYVSSDGRIFYFAILLILFSLIEYRRNELIDILLGHIIANIIILSLTAVSYFQGLTIGDFTIGVIRQGELRYLRGLLQDQNPYAAQLGAALISTLMYGFYLIKTKKRLSANFLTTTIIGIIFFLALLFCLSRGFIFGFIIAMLWLFFASTSIRQLIKLPARIAIIVFIALSPLLYISLFPSEISGLRNRTDTSLLRRTFIIEETTTRFLQSPLFGLGIGGHREFATEYQSMIPHVLSLRVSGKRLSEIIYDGNRVYGQHAHNLILFLLTDFGIVGTSIFIYFFSYYFLLKKHQPHRELWLATLHLRTGLVYMLAAGAFAAFTLTSTPISTIFYINIAFISQQLKPALASHTRGSFNRNSEQLTVSSNQYL